MTRSVATLMRAPRALGVRALALALALALQAHLGVMASPLHAPGVAPHAADALAAVAEAGHAGAVGRAAPSHERAARPGAGPDRVRGDAVLARAGSAVSPGAHGELDRAPDDHCDTGPVLRPDGAGRVLWASPRGARPALAHPARVARLDAGPGVRPPLIGDAQALLQVFRI